MFLKARLLSIWFLFACKRTWEPYFKAILALTNIAAIYYSKRFAAAKERTKILIWLVSWWLPSPPGPQNNTISSSLCGVTVLIALVRHPGEFKSKRFQAREEFLHLRGGMQSVAQDFQRPSWVTNWKCLSLVYSPDRVKRKILEVWVKRQARLVQINGLIISYWETIPKR